MSEDLLLEDLGDLFGSNAHASSCPKRENRGERRGAAARAVQASADALCGAERRSRVSASWSCSSRPRTLES